jgi:cellulose biosynthesis protein BcsQ
MTQIFYKTDKLDTINPSQSIYRTFRADGSMGPDPFPADLRTRESPPGARFHVDLIPGSFETLRFGIIGGARATAMIENFKEFIEKCKSDYDFVILDTNPASTFTTLCSLAVADYVVAPVTLDIFSVRGIQLIREVMAENYPWLGWLADGSRVKVILNRIPRTSDPEKRKKIVEQETRIRSAFPLLSESIMPDRIHETSLLHNVEPGLGFALDRVRRGFFAARARKALKTDLERTATDLVATVNGRG